MGTNNNNNGSFVPARIYNNADIDKLQILSDNKGKTGIYQWTHKESGKTYVGSAVDLEKRLSNYFNKKHLENNPMYISRALLPRGRGAFSLTILEYIDISGLSKSEARKLIIKREQFYLDELKPEYNILKVAGSLLGYKHSEEAKALISEIHKGKTLSAETKDKIRKAKLGENHPRGMQGKAHSLEVKAKISIAKGGGTIYVYDSQDSLVNTFSSAREAGKEFDKNHQTIMRYVRNGKLFQDKWKFSLSLITKE